MCGQVRLGQAGPGWDGAAPLQARLGQAGSGWVRLDQAGSGLIRLAWPGLAWLGFCVAWQPSTVLIWGVVGDINAI